MLGTKYAKTTDVLELVVAFLGHKEAEQRRVYGGSGGPWLGRPVQRLLPFPLRIRERSPDPLCPEPAWDFSVSTPQSKQPLSPTVLDPPSVFPAAV